MKQIIPDKSHKLSVICGKCGVKLIRMVRHWEKVSCTCGREFIALEPKRNGPMGLFHVKPL